VRVVGSHHRFLLLLNTANNIANTADVLNIKPTATGTITFQATKEPNNTNATGFYYLGAIQLITTDAIHFRARNTLRCLCCIPSGEIWHATKPLLLLGCSWSLVKCHHSIFC
jgi:hypothetical protein